MNNSYESHLKFRWTAHSDDGVWSDHSANFDTQEECYKDMMNHAIDKMKWNIEWEDVVSDGATKQALAGGIITTGQPIGYELKVNADRISHTSYSGTYSWQIEKVLDDWNPRFKCNDILRKGTTVAIVACANENAIDPDNFGYTITIVGHNVPRYNEWTRDPEHWISCDDEKNWSKIGEVTMDVENGEV